MTETTIKFENEQIAEKTYQIGDKFAIDDNVYVLSRNGMFTFFININSGVSWQPPVKCSNSNKVSHTEFKRIVGEDFVSRFKHLENVEIVVK